MSDPSNSISSIRTAQGTVTATQQAQTAQADSSAAAKAQQAAQTTQTRPTTPTQVTPQTHVDGVDQKTASTTATVTGTGTMTPEQRQIADNQREIAQLQQQLAAKDKQQAEEAKKPSFTRALLEVFEFIGRWFTPFFNLVSAAFRLLKIGYKLLTGQKINWKDEGTRLAGDIAGIFFPPAGAIVNAGMNIFDPFGDPNNKGRSEILGGMDELMGSPKNSPWREGFDAVSSTLKKVFDGAKNLITGNEPASGGIQTAPLAPNLTT